MQEIIKGNQRMIQRFGVKGSDTTFVEVELWYEKGGPTCNGHSVQRGLHVVVCPVEVKDGWKTTTAYTGFRECVLKMERASQKKFDDFYAQIGVFLPRWIKLIEEKTGLEVVL